MKRCFTTDKVDKLLRLWGSKVLCTFTTNFKKSATLSPTPIITLMKIAVGSAEWEHDWRSGAECNWSYRNLGEILFMFTLSNDLLETFLSFSYPTNACSEDIAQPLMKSRQSSVRRLGCDTLTAASHHSSSFPTSRSASSAELQVQKRSKVWAAESAAPRRRASPDSFCRPPSTAAGASKSRRELPAASQRSAHATVRHSHWCLLFFLIHGRAAEHSGRTSTFYALRNRRSRRCFQLVSIWRKVAEKSRPLGGNKTPLRCQVSALFHTDEEHVID